jgi:hypothetical protein
VRCRSDRNNDLLGVILADPEQFLRLAYDYVIIGKPRITRFQMRARPAMINARWGHRRAGCCNSVRFLYSLLSKRFKYRRLSEDPRLKIGVIEAGNAKFNDSLVDTPSMGASHLLPKSCTLDDLQDLSEGLSEIQYMTGTSSRFPKSTRLTR